MSLHRFYTTPSAFCYFHRIRACPDHCISLQGGQDGSVPAGTAPWRLEPIAMKQLPDSAASIPPRSGSCNQLLLLPPLTHAGGASGGEIRSLQDTPGIGAATTPECRPGITGRVEDTQVTLFCDTLLSQALVTAWPVKCCSLCRIRVCLTKAGGNTIPAASLRSELSCCAAALLSCITADLFHSLQSTGNLSEIGGWLCRLRSCRVKWRGSRGSCGSRRSSSGTWHSRRRMRMLSPPRYASLAEASLVTVTALRWNLTVALPVLSCGSAADPSNYELRAHHQREGPSVTGQGAQRFDIQHPSQDLNV